VRALRQLIAGLWAAVWLRGRLLGLRLRRLLGNHQSADSGPDNPVSSSAPMEGVDYEPADLPTELVVRLEFTRVELLDAAREVSRRTTRPTLSRRGPSIAVAIAALLGLGVMGAGASALVAGSTGVPAVDRLLGIYGQELSKPEAADRLGPSASGIQPSASKASEPIEVELTDGSRVSTSFYVARDGELCVAVVETGGGGNGDTGMVGCEAPEGVARRLAQEGGYVPGIRALDHDVVLSGYVRDDVVDLSGRGPSGNLRTYLGQPWRPELPGMSSLKPFVAVGSRSGRADSDPRGVLDLEGYSFEAVTSDGRRMSIVP
jgi:hypothetical protein